MQPLLLDSMTKSKDGFLGVSKGSFSLSYNHNKGCLPTSHYIGRFLLLHLWRCTAGVAQLSERPALLDQPRCAFLLLLHQPVQGVPATQEQGRRGGHVVGDPQRAQHLHRVPAQQSLPPSLSEGQRGTSELLTVCHRWRLTTGFINAPSLLHPQVLIHSLLSMFHPRPFVRSRFAPQGAVACIRASSDFYFDIIFR